jgi:protein-ribulosamine 3-kinase
VSPLLTDDITNHLIGQFSGSLKIIKCSHLGGGCINHACKLETNHGLFFLKWISSGPVDLFLREQESLIEMQKSNNEHIVFPKPLFAKAIDTTPGYLLTDFLENRRIGNDEERLGHGLATLHKLTSEKFGFHNDNYCGSTIQDNTHKSDWCSFYSENRIMHLVNLIKTTRDWSIADDQVTEKFLLKVEKLLSHNPVPSLIHGDLWSGNYIYSSRGPALIDPASSYCDREFEMGIMTMFGGFSQRVYDAYNEIFPLPVEWKERNQIYQLYHVLNHYYLFGGYYKNQALEIMKHYL